jgi:hypothetical protein
LPSYRFWFYYLAGPATTLAERISILGDESVEQASCIAEGESLSHNTNQPSGREQKRQTRDGIPADIDFTFGSDHVQLAQAFIHLESGIDRRQDRSADGQTDRLVLMVESVQPRHTSLTNFALSVVKDSVGRVCLPSG